MGIIRKTANELSDQYGLTYKQAEYLGIHLLVGQTPERILNKLIERREITQEMADRCKKRGGENATERLKQYEKAFERIDGLIEFLNSDAKVNLNGDEA